MNILNIIFVIVTSMYIKNNLEIYLKVIKLYILYTDVRLCQKKISFILRVSYFVILIVIKRKKERKKKRNYMEEQNLALCHK